MPQRLDATLHLLPRPQLHQDPAYAALLAALPGAQVVAGGADGLLGYQASARIAARLNLVSRQFFPLPLAAADGGGKPLACGDARCAHCGAAPVEQPAAIGGNEGEPASPSASKGGNSMLGEYPTSRVTHVRLLTSLTAAPAVGAACSSAAAGRPVVSHADLQGCCPAAVQQELLSSKPALKALVEVRPEQTCKASIWCHSHHAAISCLSSCTQYNVDCGTESGRLSVHRVFDSYVLLPLCLRRSMQSCIRRPQHPSRRPRRPARYCRPQPAPQLGPSIPRRYTVPQATTTRQSPGPAALRTLRSGTRRRRRSHPHCRRTLASIPAGTHPCTPTACGRRTVSTSATTAACLQLERLALARRLRPGATRPGSCRQVMKLAWRTAQRRRWHRHCRQPRRRCQVHQQHQQPRRQRQPQRKQHQRQRQHRRQRQRLFLPTGSPPASCKRP